LPQDALLDLVGPPPPSRSGRAVRLGPDARGDGELLEVVAPDGTVELRVHLTPSGPVLRLEGVRVEVRASEALDLSAPRVRVHADERLEIASRGDVAIAAGDDVRVDGERIWLNR
jgi:hypothetical protein